MKHALPAFAAALFLAFAAPSQAAPPKPLPNPDQPAVTPIVQAGGADASSSADATASAARICPTLRRLARRGNGAAGLRVMNLRTGKNVCTLNSVSRRSLASNNKLFTIATTLDRLGRDQRLQTRVLAGGKIDKGVLKGNLYLKGAGDPSFGTSRFVDTWFGGQGSEIEKLALKVRQSGIKRVTGRLFYDDSVFDRVRGVADSGYATSPWIGPLSGLSFNEGFTSPSLSRFSNDPARLAARTLVRAMRARGVKMKVAYSPRTTPTRLLKRVVAREVSPDMAWMARATLLDSNNFFAETLLKVLGASILKSGTTANGVKVVRRTMAALKVNVWPIDGSGLTYGNRSTAHDVVKLLYKARSEPWGKALLDGMPTAGVDGTLADRMRGSAAQGNCHAKTGTLTGVSALSGYCFNQSGRKFAFSILMNDVSNLDRAHNGQDRIAALIARL
jgi:D-alanyl-D-alanine carboxypeptidase/D-alanyl-D-alanine-endopeptidase (penicillin-binding protein 4)